MSKNDFKLFCKVCGQMRPETEFAVLNYDSADDIQIMHIVCPKSKHDGSVNL